MALVLDLIRKFMPIKRVYRTRRVINLIAILVLFTLALVYVRMSKVKERPIVVVDLNYTYTILQADLARSVAESRGRGCQMPRLDPFDKEAMRFVKDLPKVVCEGIDWVECFLDECYVVKPILAAYENVFCEYEDIMYVDDFSHTMGPSTKLAGEAKYQLTVSDHVRVACVGSGRRGDSSSPELVRWAGLRAGLRRLPRAPGRCCGPRLNVLMLCFDSTAKSGFIRKMPLANAALEEMGAVFLNGYNIVGDGIPAALFPILTGRSELEFPEIRRMFTQDTIDARRFIFSHLSGIGYRTAFFEDSPSIGTFQYQFNGFSHQPADHYLRPVLREYEEHFKTKDYCFGATPVYGLLLNLTHQFFQLDGNRFAFTFIVDISHDDFNMISTADEDLALFLRRIQQGGKMRETVLFVMGDHGSRETLNLMADPRVMTTLFGTRRYEVQKAIHEVMQYEQGSRFSGVRETLQGKLEERLPLMAIVLPDLLLKTRPGVLETLRGNADVLTTPFDIHSTLTDILGIGDVRNRYTVPGATMPRGNTLLQPIPRTRSCGEAGVLPHWCACAAWRRVAARRARARAAAALAGYVNNLTAEYRHQCQAWTLSSIASVLRLSPNQELLRFEGNSDVDGHLASFAGKTREHSEMYQAKIVMSPGEAVFEGSMKYFPSEGYFAITERDVSRISA